MSSVSAIANNVDMAQVYLEKTNRILAEGHITADAIVAQNQAETLVEAEVAVMEKALEVEKSTAQSMIDLLA